MIKEFVKLYCKVCLCDLGYAVEPVSIPRTWCSSCVTSYREAEKEYEHCDD